MYMYMYVYVYMYMYVDPGVLRGLGVGGPQEEKEGLLGQEIATHYMFVMRVHVMIHFITLYYTYIL